MQKTPYTYIYPISKIVPIFAEVFVSGDILDLYFYGMKTEKAFVNTLDEKGKGGMYKRIHDLVTTNMTNKSDSILYSVLYV